MADGENLTYVITITSKALVDEGEKTEHYLVEAVIAGDAKASTFRLYHEKGLDQIKTYRKGDSIEVEVWERPMSRGAGLFRNINKVLRKVEGIAVPATASTSGGADLAERDQRIGRQECAKMATEVALEGFRSYWTPGTNEELGADLRQFLDAVMAKIDDLTEFFVELTTPGYRPEPVERPPGGREPQDRPPERGTPPGAASEGIYTSWGSLMKVLSSEAGIGNPTMLQKCTGSSPNMWMAWGKDQGKTLAEILEHVHVEVRRLEAGHAKE